MKRHVPNAKEPVSCDELAKALHNIHRRYDNDPNLHNRYAYEWFMKAEDAAWYHSALEAVYKAEDRSARAIHNVTMLAIAGIILALLAIAPSLALIFGWL